MINVAAASAMNKNTLIAIKIRPKSMGLSYNTGFSLTDSVVIAKRFSQTELIAIPFKRKALNLQGCTCEDLCNIA